MPTKNVVSGFAGTVKSSSYTRSRGRLLGSRPSMRMVRTMRWTLSSCSGSAMRISRMSSADIPPAPASPEESATTWSPGSAQRSPGGIGRGTHPATDTGQTAVRSVTVLPERADLPASSREMYVPPASP